MADTFVILSNIRKSLFFLWEEYGFGFTELKPRDGQIVSDAGEKIGARANYTHYYVINEILEQISKIMKEEYVEIQLHRKKDNFGRISYRFVLAE